MKFKLLTLALLFLLVGCSNDYEYSGKLIINGAISDVDVYIFVFEGESHLMELPLSNNERKAELIPGYYTLKVEKDQQWAGQVNFQIIAGKTTRIMYNTANNIVVAYN